MKSNYSKTRIACYLGYVVQALVVNYAPLLFLTFREEFGISLARITLLITVNFTVQIAVDSLSTVFVPRLGYRFCAVCAHAAAFAGVAGLAVLPGLIGYGGLLLCTVLYAVGGGLTEVVISPIIEACPSDNKSGSMSLLHSFYCWGQAGVVLLSTLFFAVSGIGNWRIWSLILSLIPLFNMFMFIFVPIRTLEDGGRRASATEILKNKVFWLFVLLMICAGASEIAVSQWSSAFAEKGLNVRKEIGDLCGPCAFAILMGIARTLYAIFSKRIDLRKFITACALLCVGGYLLAALSPSPILALAGCGLAGFSVGIMWPGTLSMASEACPDGGASMFALLALAGDTGCTLGPTLVGLVSDSAGDNISVGLLFGTVFPAILVLGMLLSRKRINIAP